MTDEPSFGLPKGEEIHKEYIGEYVVIYPSNGTNNFAGRIKKIKNGFAVLNPHQGGIYTKEGLVKKMIEKDAEVDIIHINGIEPTTKESLENFCELYNKRNNQNIK